jgi:hypothetical protein
MPEETSIKSPNVDNNGGGGFDSVSFDANITQTETGEEITDPGKSISTEDEKVSVTGAAASIEVFFSLISQIRRKKLWKLDDQDKESVKNTLPGFIEKVPIARLLNKLGVVAFVLVMLQITLSRLFRDIKEIRAGVTDEEDTETEQAGPGGRAEQDKVTLKAEGLTDAAEKEICKGF